MVTATGSQLKRNVPCAMLRAHEYIPAKPDIWRDDILNVLESHLDRVPEGRR